MSNTTNSMFVEMVEEGTLELIKAIQSNDSFDVREDWDKLTIRVMTGCYVVLRSGDEGNTQLMERWSHHMYALASTVAHFDLDYPESHLQTHVSDTIDFLTGGRTTFLLSLDAIRKHFQVLHRCAYDTAEERGTDIGLYQHAVDLGMVLEFLREALDTFVEGAEDANQN